ncbi:MAG: DUF1871 family protein [Planctomycetota bacterium]|nr:DUF1871 family protein [Planctomycetota bacterium]MDA0917890.1 DUF1871 family protein [Planctomycetota bacterium]MDA1159103.1 DUF1871 family protein [Planctomycetota bacterium]
MTLSTRKDYDRAVSVVRAVIKRWDPYSLLAGGAPVDEFDSEIASVTAQIPRIRSSNDAVHAVSRVFSSAFDAEAFSIANCTEVGNHLYSAHR